ncbi:MAG: glutathione S-transferase family protein [Sphingobium sp.]|uniref:glutathione S-transferase family protein n=1 Tax=Sphingobium sp. TaxID=1912891 RepID=UPI002E212D0F
MITLHAFAPAFGLPSPGPFVMKTEVQLQMMRLPYRCVIDRPTGAPKGKLPFIEDDGAVVADSTFIRFHLEAKYAVDLDTGWDDRSRAKAWAIERLVEDQLYWAMVYSRWAIDANFAKGPAHFFDALPEEVQDEARQKQRRAVLSYLDGQGIGRHASDDIAQLARHGYASLAKLLGDRLYILGERPCGADASVFAQLASALTPFFDSPVRDAAASCDNLVAYSRRMMVAYFPDFADPADTQSL